MFETSFGLDLDAQYLVEREFKFHIIKFILINQLIIFTNFKMFHHELNLSNKLRLFFFCINDTIYGLLLYKGFIDFIVEPSFQVMSDVVDKILEPMQQERLQGIDWHIGLIALRPLVTIWHDMIMMHDMAGRDGPVCGGTHCRYPPRRFSPSFGQGVRSTG